MRRTGYESQWFPEVAHAVNVATTFTHPKVDGGQAICGRIVAGNADSDPAQLVRSPVTTGS